MEMNIPNIFNMNYHNSPRIFRNLIHETNFYKSLIIIILTNYLQDTNLINFCVNVVGIEIRSIFVL